MKIFIYGYPGDVGGACTELWHTIKLWRRNDVDVHLITSSRQSGRWQRLVDEQQCATHVVDSSDLESVDGLPGSIVVSFCNSGFLANASRLKEMDCKLVWVNCMTWLFDAEKKFYGEHGMFDAFVFQSEFQRSELEPQLATLGYTPERGHLIRGAFDCSEFEFQPRPHVPGDVFVVGRMARADLDKWSSNTWPIYDRIQYALKKAIMLGLDDRVMQKLGPSPFYAECLKPGAIPVAQYLACLHCLLPINGGARENWPRAGLEAMAAGVPVIAQNEWGWREMIEHGVTGFLGNDDCELAHYAACLAYDENLRMRVARAAHERLANELSDSGTIWSCWEALFASLTRSCATIAEAAA